MQTDQQKSRVARQKQIKKAKIKFEIQQHNSAISIANRHLGGNRFFQDLMDDKRAVPKANKGDIANLEDFVSPANDRYKHLAPSPIFGLYYRLYDHGRLRLRHLEALDRFVSDAYAASGNSKGMTAQLTEKVDQSNALKAPHAYLGSFENESYKRIRHIWNGLKDHEKTLLYVSITLPMVAGDQKAGSAILRADEELNVQGVGKASSGYRDKNSSAAAGVSRVHSLLDSLAEIYGIKEN